VPVIWVIPVATIREGVNSDLSIYFTLRLHIKTLIGKNEDEPLLFWCFIKNKE
jgi:hypothetical protein